MGFTAASTASAQRWPRSSGRGIRRWTTATVIIYELSEEENSDWGLLDAGTRVIDAFYYNIVFAPSKKPLMYTPSSPPIRVRVPTHLLLIAGFSTPLAPPGKSVQHRAAVAKGAVIIGDHLHDDILQELAVRAARLE